MSRASESLLIAPVFLAVFLPAAATAGPPPAQPPSPAPAAIAWHTDYAIAMDIAEKEGRMMLVFFRDGKDNQISSRFKARTLDQPLVQTKLQGYSCVEVPLDAKIISGGKEVVLLKHEAFREMLGRPGIAIVDFAHRDSRLYGSVVSVFPLTGQLWYTPQQMAVILDLPPGTLTQRTLIYAVRTHPEAPASTSGTLDENLVGEAESHSTYQARIRLQGHHRWDFRFRRINARLPGGLVAKEVCAESWPGQNLVDAAVECVRSWRCSSGHWSAVRARQRFYAYDMKLGTNGVWYATGIFGGRD